MAATCGLSVGFELARRRSSVLPAQRAWAARQRIVLLRPLHGVTPYLDDCLESLWLAASNAGASIRLAAERAGQLQPAAESQLEAVLVALRERYPRVRAELVRGKGPAGSNRKVANLVQGLDQASFDVLVLSDADMDVPPDYVTSVVGPLRDPVVGLTTCPYRSVPVRSLVSRIDALLTNTRFLPNTCMAVSKEALHFALGVDDRRPQGRARVSRRTRALARRAGRRLHVGAQRGRCRLFSALGAATARPSPGPKSRPGGPLTGNCVGCARYGARVALATRG